MPVAERAGDSPAPALVGWLFAGAALCLSFPMALLSTAFSVLALAAVVLARPSRVMAAIRAMPALAFALALFAWIGLRTVAGEAGAADALHGWFEYHELLVLPLLAAIALDPVQRGRALAGFIAGTLVGAAVSYARFVGLLPELPVPLNFAPPRGPIGGAWMMLLSAFACVLLARGAAGGRRFALAAAGAALLGVVLFLIAGRTAYVSLLLLAALLLAGAGRRRVLLGALALVSAFALAWVASPHMRDRVIDTFVRPPGSERVNSTAIRLEYYRVSSQVALDAPLLGHGTGSFAAAYARKAAELGSPGLLTDNPHNQYLLLAAETGLPGVLLFVALLAAAWRQARGMRPESALLLRGVTITMATSCLFNSFLLDGAEGRAFVLLLALAMTDRGPGGATDAPAVAHGGNAIS